MLYYIMTTFYCFFVDRLICSHSIGSEVYYTRLNVTLQFVCDHLNALAISVGGFSTAKNPNIISVGITAKLAQL